MGLDISFYQAARMLPADAIINGGIDEGKYSDGWVAYVNPDFPAQADGLPERFAFAPEGEGRHARIGYWGYGHWQECVARSVGYPKAEPMADEDAMAAAYRERMPHVTSAWRGHVGPLHALLNFSDCEGVIGPQTCATIAAELAEYRDRALAEMADNPRAAAFYDAVAEGFAIVGPTGFARFH